MKMIVRSLLAASALAFTTIMTLPAGFAQAPAGAPAGSTGLCIDGTYWTGASKSGACRGHKGVKTWYAQAAAPSQPTAAATPAPPAGAAMAPKPKTSTTAKVAAPGGGPGMVWVNTSTKVYHCYGTANYGTTKAGAYMSEADAKAKGAHGVAGKPCS